MVNEVADVIDDIADVIDEIPDVNNDVADVNGDMVDATDVRHPLTVRGEVSNHERKPLTVRPSIPQGERLFFARLRPRVWYAGNCSCISA